MDGDNQGALFHEWLSCPHNFYTVPVFKITPPNITVVEDEPGVLVCVVTNSSLATEVVAILQTAPKLDAAARATGNYNDSHLSYRGVISYVFGVTNINTSI